MATVSNDLREELAEYAHDAWSEWMKYMFGKCEESNGDMVIPAPLVARWKRQMDTPYADLPESEKASDREQSCYIVKVLCQQKLVE